MRSLRRPLLGSALALLLAGCGGWGEPVSKLDAVVAAALADSLRMALGARFEPPIEVRYGKFASPPARDSIAGYVIRMSAPYEMVADDTLPHQWLRARLSAGGWTVQPKAETADAAAYRAVAAGAAVTVEAAWEDLHDPANVPDWYSLTIGIPSKAPAR